MSDGKWDNTGILKPNDRIEDDCDTWGSMNIEGVDYDFRGYSNDERTEMDLEIQKRGTRGDNKGKGKLKKVLDHKGGNYPHWLGIIRTAKEDEYELAAWKKQPSGKILTPWLSFKVTKPEASQDSEPPAEQPKEGEFPF